MARPRTPIGTFGQIDFRTNPNGSVRARTRFRDDDGQLRPVEATGPTHKAAERNLKEKIARRGHYATGMGELSPDTTFAKLVEVWLEDIELEDRIAASTRELLGLCLQEAIDLADRGTARLRPPPSTAMALTIIQVEVIRQAVRSWRRGQGLSGPKPDGQLEAIIEVMLGTSARIGEVSAIRKRDADVTCSPPTVRICGTVISPTGKPTYRQDHPKTSKSRRTMSIPTFAAEVLRKRLVVIANEDPEHLVFFSRNHTPLTTNNVRRRLRAILTGRHAVTARPAERTCDMR